MEEYANLLEKIKVEREILHIYQNEMAVALDIDERTYREKEKGIRKFSLLEFIQICSKLNRNPSYFFNAMNNYSFQNCINSGNSGGDFTYNEKEINKDTLYFIIEAISEKLRTKQK